MTEMGMVNKKRKKILLLFFTCILLLTACGKSDDAEDTAADSDLETEMTTDADSQTEEEDAVIEEEDALTTAGQNQNSHTEGGRTVYTYEEISVTIPKEWEGKYMVQESEDGISFLQTASHEKAEGLGFLCGFYRSDSMVDQSIGAMQLAYTGDTMYYYQEPTDVNCYYEDEQIVAEYSAMMEKTKEMRESLQIAKADVRYDAQEFEYPLSDKKLISEDLLWNVDNNALWIGRNEIYARHGRKFDNVYLQNYFETCSWYEATTESADFKEDTLSDVEKENLRLIQAEEEKRKQENPYPKAYAMSDAITIDLDGDGTAEEVCCQYEEDTANWDYKVTIRIDDMVYDLSQQYKDVYFLNLYKEHFYVTDIFPSEAGYELALMDYGPSDDPVTYFFSYDGGLNYLGAVSGFPFREEQGLDGFALEGLVMGLSRIDIINTCYAYSYWYYDREQQMLVSQNPGGSMLLMRPDGGYKLNKDLTLYREMDTGSDTVVLKAQDKVFFLYSDGKEWILVKGKDGVQGYMHCDSEHIDGMTESPQEIFEGLQYTD